MERKLSYKIISNVLSTVYPGNADKDIFNEKNIQNHYKAALALIHGGYKDYLSS